MATTIPTNRYLTTLVRAFALDAFVWPWWSLSTSQGVVMSNLIVCSPISHALRDTVTKSILEA